MSSPVQSSTDALHTATLNKYRGPPQSIYVHFSVLLLLLYHVVVVVTVLCCSYSYITMYVQLQINKKK